MRTKVRMVEAMLVVMNKRKESIMDTLFKVGTHLAIFLHLRGNGKSFFGIR